jgi:2-polyprenyl-3-methyl-5-hydroxy-6-metoxy-1,4-benzoquinol methylase
MSMYEDGEYFQLHPTWDEEHSAWKAGHIAGIIDRNRLEFSSYVDIGCGAGRIVHELSLKYPSVVFHGYDVSPQAIALAGKYETRSVRFFEGDVFTDRHREYDVAAAVDVFEHVDDYIGFLKKVAGLARYGIFHIPLDISVQAILRELPMNNRKTAGHLHYFMKDTALATLAYAGLEVLDWFYTPGGIALAQSWRGKLAAIPRRLFFTLSPDACAKVLGGYSVLALTDNRARST